MNDKNPAQQYRSRLLTAVAEQQTEIEGLKRTNATILDAVKTLVGAAGVQGHQRFASLMSLAADGTIDTTTEQAKKPLATDDVESKGAAPGEANKGVTPAAVTDVQNSNVALPDNGTLQGLVDVTAPVAGTDAVDPAAVFNGEVRVDKGKEESMSQTPSGWTGTPGSTNRTSSRGDDVERFTTSLRLARLQIQAGLAQGEDVTIAQRIYEGSQPLSEIATVAQTLTAVATVKQASAPTQEHRHLVPQPAQQGGGVAASQAKRISPSMATASLPAAVASANERGEDEWTFG